MEVLRPSFKLKSLAYNGCSTLDSTDFTISYCKVQVHLFRLLATMASKLVFTSILISANMRLISPLSSGKDFKTDFHGSCGLCSISMESLLKTVLAMSSLARVAVRTAETRFIREIGLLSESIGGMHQCGLVRSSKSFASVGCGSVQDPAEAVKCNS